MSELIRRFRELYVLAVQTESEAAEFSQVLETLGGCPDLDGEVIDVVLAAVRDTEDGNHINNDLASLLCAMDMDLLVPRLLPAFAALHERAPVFLHDVVNLACMKADSAAKFAQFLDGLESSTRADVLSILASDREFLELPFAAPVFRRFVGRVGEDAAGEA
jgi:hypothetical protein